MASDRRFAGALHAVLLSAALGAGLTGLASQTWPWYLLTPLLLYAGVVLAMPKLRQTAPRLKVGRLGGAPLAYSVFLIIATSAVLAIFHSLARPDVSALTAKLPASAFGSLVLAGAIFSIVNATMEEIVFRGLLWSVIANEWNNGVALVITSVIFGIVHLNGYPPGLVGAVLAGLYGLALGILRRWTGGIALAFACHVCADATIFALVFDMHP